MEQREVPITPLDQAVDGLNSLADALIEFEAKSRSALGFTQTLHYKDVSFLVSDRFVIPDLRPLAFVGLLEEVGDDANVAVVRLYERVAPLLLCQHIWSDAQHLEDDGVAIEDGILSTSAFDLCVCKRCTAYCSAKKLPQVGRDS
jgi:hypothetical protein